MKRLSPTFFFAFYLNALAQDVPAQTSERQVMGTLFQLTLDAPKSPSSEEAIHAAFQRIEDVDRISSEWKFESPLSTISKNAGIQPVKIPVNLLSILKISLTVAKESNGAFDPTWAALWGLWTFDAHAKVPAKSEVKQRLKLVNWRNLTLNEQEQMAYLTHKGMVLGLGAIAKGYALQVAADELRHRGFGDFLLNAGGQVLAGGHHRGKAWNVGIQHPRKIQEGMLGILQVSNVSVSTSGDYEHFFIQNGIRYHHIIDLKTGFPSRNAQSATVIHPDATLADAYSTACFVLGAEKGLALAKKLGFDLILVDDQGKVSMTDGARQLLATH